MSNRIGYAWFTCGSTVGIVLAHDATTDKLKAWIKGVSGTSKEDDLKDIHENGAKFPVQEAISIINNKGEWDLKMEEIAAMTEKEGAW